MKSYLTAIRRNRPSAPARFLIQNKLVPIGSSVLDFGCGYGKDAETYKWAGFDPYYNNWRIHNTRFNFIVCTYVLNTLEYPAQCLYDALNLLLDNGLAYFSVRRDIKKAHYTKKGTYQAPIYLGGPGVKSLHKTSTYELYQLNNNSIQDGIHII